MKNKTGYKKHKYSFFGVLLLILLVLPVETFTWELSVYWVWAMVEDQQASLAEGVGGS